MRPWELEDGITPSCAPLTWGSLECRRFAALLRLTPQVRGHRVSSSVCVACGANRGGGSKTRRGLLPPRRQILQLRYRLRVIAAPAAITRTTPIPLSGGGSRSAPRPSCSTASTKDASRLRSPKSRYEATCRNGTLHCRPPLWPRPQPCLIP